MKQLIIHPEDRSTIFLSRLYRDLPDATIVTGGVPRAHLRKMIDQHDQVIMMGHGSPYGLLSVGRFNGHGYVIDDSFAGQLSERDNSVFIWCNADAFVKWHRLRGFYTGMFISESAEAHMCGIPVAREDEIEESNDTFMDVVGRFIRHEPRLIWAAARHEYGKLAQRNPVAAYNHRRLYLS